MTPLTISLFILLAAALTVLWWVRTRSRATNQYAAVLARHGSDAMISSHASLANGGRHIPVALTLEPARLFYENADLQATVDIDQIDEVEYTSDLLTGDIATGAVLRLRAHGRSLEFILDVSAAEKWSRFLPPHRMDQPGKVHAG